MFQKILTWIGVIDSILLIVLAIMTFFNVIDTTVFFLVPELILLCVIGIKMYKKHLSYNNQS